MADNDATMPVAGEQSPLHHTRRIREALKAISDHMRDDINKIEEPQAKAMFETSADVLDGIITSFAHYEVKSEQAWKR